MSTILEDEPTASLDSDVDIDVDESQDDLSQTPALKGRVALPKVLLALNQMAVMSQNGIDLAEAVQTAAAHTQDNVLADQLDRIHDAVTSGQSLSGAVAFHGTSFPSTFAPMLAAAEATGTVPEALQRTATMIRSDLQLRSSVLGALIYPIILIGASVLVMLALVFGILPRFATVFEQLGKPSPPLTQALLDLGVFCKENLWFCLGGFIAMIVGGCFVKKTMWYRKLRDITLLYCPVIKNAYRPLSTGRLFRLLGSMIKGGVPLLDAIRLAKRSTDNELISEMLENTEQDLIDGHSASKAMAEADFLPPEAAHMLTTAERTGRLAEVLSDIGVFYEEEGAAALKKLVSLLEPVIILAMGLLVSGIVLSIMLPLLDVSTAQG